MRNQYLPWMVCAAIAGVGAPAIASGSETRSANATVETHDNVFKDLADGNTVAEIVTGETVYFVSPVVPTNPSPHNVAFRDGPQPSVCNQTKLSPGDTTMDNDGVPPMPNEFHGPGWEGYCTFAAPGTYQFYCELHGGMEGTVIVSGTPTATATPTTTPTATATATATPPPATNPAPAPTAAPQAPAPTPDAASPKPKLSTATFKRSKRTVSVAGTLAATGKVRVALSYRAGTKPRKKTLSLSVRNGRFSGKLKLSGTDARRASKLSVTVTYAGEKAKRSVKVSR